MVFILRVLRVLRARLWSGFLGFGQAGDFPDDFGRPVVGQQEGQAIGLGFGVHVESQFPPGDSGIRKDPDSVTGNVRSALGHCRFAGKARE